MPTGSHFSSVSFKTFFSPLLYTVFSFSLYGTPLFIFLLFCTPLFFSFFLRNAHNTVPKNITWYAYYTVFLGYVCIASYTTQINKCVTATLLPY
jgi:hypothetical protein